MCRQTQRFSALLCSAVMGLFGVCCFLFGSTVFCYKANTLVQPLIRDDKCVNPIERDMNMVSQCCDVT